MCHTVTRTADGREQFDTGIEYHKPFRLDRYWQWKDELWTDPYFTWLSFALITEDNQTVYVSQGIAFQRYVYASSLVNEWDGTSLTLDEENGAVLATMIAAGTKNAKNQFTGVMLGNWSSKADSSMDQAGLYGFQNGAMSFGFTEDGTGFIGPSGAGRIQFDGRNAMISNSTKTCYINLNPVTLTYYDTERHWYDSSDAGKSQYFLYCKVPVNPNDLSTPYSEKVKMKWADQFMNDDANNYFIVDPNQGALITGGIATKYGRIGNWYINDNGLYQIYEDKDNPKNSRFMYLGMPSLEKVDTNIDDKLEELDAGYKAYVTQQRRYTIYWALTSYMNDSTLSTEERTKKIQDLFDDFPQVITYDSTQNAENNANRIINNLGTAYSYNVPLPAGSIYENGVLQLSYKETSYIEEYLKEKLEGASGDIDSWQPGEVEAIFRNLSKYFNQSLFTEDVYHFYTMGTSAYNSAMYLQRALNELQNYDEAHRTPEELYNLIYDASKLTYQGYNPDNPNDWSVDGPFSLRNLETHLHNHYSIAGTNGRRAYYAGPTTTSRNAVVTPAGQPYRTTANYGYQNNIRTIFNGVSWTVSDSSYWEPETNPANEASLTFPDTSYPTDSQYIYEFNPKERYYDENLQDYAWRDASQYAAYIRITPIGEPAPRYRPGASVSVSFYNGSNNPTMTWEKNTHVTLNAVPFNSDDNFLSVSGSSMRLMNSVLKYGSGTVDPARLALYIQSLLLVYDYYRKCFCWQLADMLESGLATLQQTDPDEYNAAMTIIDAIGGIEQVRNGAVDITGTAASSVPDSLDIDDEKIRIRAQLLREEANQARIEEFKAKIQKLRQEMMRKLFEESDANKFAIYAGYQSPFNGGMLATNPFFSVRWNGYMTARHGRIGTDSPWYISDAGLTQTNNFGTIFLGSPDQDGQVTDDVNLINPNKASFMDEYGRPIGVRGDNGSYETYLLPNGGVLTIPGNMIEGGDGSDELKYVRLYTCINGPSSGYANQDRDEYGHQIHPPTHQDAYVYVRYHDDHYWLYQYHYWSVDDATNQEALIIDETRLDTFTNETVWVKYKGPNAFGDLGRFAIYAGNARSGATGSNPGIHFGVRLDGTIYADRGNLGAWLLDDTRIGTYTSYLVNGHAEIRPIIELNSEGYITIDNGNILLDGRADTKLAHQNAAVVSIGSITHNAKLFLNGFEISSGDNVSGLSANAVNSNTTTIATTGTYVWNDMRDNAVNAGNLTDDTLEDAVDEYEALVNPSTGTLVTLQTLLDQYSFQPHRYASIEQVSVIDETTGVTTTTNTLSTTATGDLEYYEKSPITNSKLASEAITVQALFNTYGTNQFDTDVLTTNNNTYVIIDNEGLQQAKKDTTGVYLAKKAEYDAAYARAQELASLIDVYNNLPDQNDSLIYPINRNASSAADQVWNFSVHYTGTDGQIEDVDLLGAKLMCTVPEYADDGLIVLVGNRMTDGNPQEIRVLLKPNTTVAGYLENWNVHGDYVVANKIYAGQELYMGGKMVATQYWVDEEVKDPLTKRIVTVNNTANDALTKAEQGISDAKKAADAAAAAAEAAAAAMEEIKTKGLYSMTTEMKNLGAEKSRLDFRFYNFYGAEMYHTWASAWSRGYKVKFQNDNGTIKACAPGANSNYTYGTETLDLSANINSISTAGSYKLEWSSMNGTEGSWDIEALKTAIETLATKLNALITAYNAHTHNYDKASVGTGDTATVATKVAGDGTATAYNGGSTASGYLSDSSGAATGSSHYFRYGGSTNTVLTGVKVSETATVVKSITSTATASAAPATSVDSVTITV